MRKEVAKKRVHEDILDMAPRKSAKVKKKDARLSVQLRESNNAKKQKVVEEDIQVEVVAGTVAGDTFLRNGAPIALVYEDPIVDLGGRVEGNQTSAADHLTGTLVLASSDPAAVSTTLSSLGGTIPAYSSQQLNMRMRNDIESVKRMCRDFARGNLFHFTKFWDEPLSIANGRKDHLPYHLSRYILMEREAILEGWSFYSKMLQRAHMDHWNNIIKKKKEIYQGAVELEEGQDLYEEGEMASFLKLRGHLPAYYLKFIVLFAVAASNNMSADFDSLLALSDKAFVVLCIVNYRERWYSETKIDKNSGSEIEAFDLPPGKFTSSNRSIKLDGNGKRNKSPLSWSNEGLEYYNALYERIEKDRFDRGEEFTKQMAMTLTEKGILKKKSGQVNSGKKLRVKPKNDMSKMTSELVFHNNEWNMEQWEDHSGDVARSNGQVEI